MQLNKTTMKKILTLITIVFISTASFSQISTVEKEDESKTIGQINLYDSTGLNGTATLKMASIIDGKQYYYLGCKIKIIQQ